MKAKINWRKYKVRTCMIDGGYGRRAHVECVEKTEEEKT